MKTTIYDLLQVLLIYLITLLIVFGLIFIAYKTDKKRCEARGGTYIWEWTYASKCHYGGTNENNNI